MSPTGLFNLLLYRKETVGFKSLILQQTIHASILVIVITNSVYSVTPVYVQAQLASFFVLLPVNWLPVPLPVFVLLLLSL